MKTGTDTWIVTVTVVTFTIPQLEKIPTLIASFHTESPFLRISPILQQFFHPPSFLGIFVKVNLPGEFELCPPMFHFCTPCKRQNTRYFLTFSEGIEIKHWNEMDYWCRSCVFIVKFKHLQHSKHNNLNF